MENLLEAVNGLMTPDMVQQASNVVGESPASTKAALTALAPTLLHAFAEKGSSPAGAGQLLGALADNKIDGKLLGNVGSILGRDKNNSAHGAGSALISMLLGGKSAGVLDAITSSAGLKSGSSPVLASIVSMLIGSLISKAVSGSGLNAAGLAGMLGGQKSMLAAALPQGMSDLLGVGAQSENATSAAATAQGVVGAPASTARAAIDSGASAARTAMPAVTAGGSSTMRWVLPVLAVAVLAVLAFLLLRPPAVDLNAAVCPPLASLESAMKTGLPVINADTKVTDVKAWMSTVKPLAEGLVTLGRAASIPVDGFSNAFKAVESTVNNVPTETLGTAAEPIAVVIAELQTTATAFKSASGCK